MELELDLLIVGHGITGANLHLRAKQEGLTCAIFDLPEENQSSSVAVGLFHPMAFRDSKLAWAGKEVFDEALSFYKNIETDEPFIQELILYRVLESTEEHNRWRARMEEPPYKEVLDFSARMDAIEAPFGLGKLRSCAKLNVANFIAKSITSLTEGHYFQEAFNYEALDAENGNFKTKGLSIQAKHIIFCEGLGVRKNPFFSHLPFHPAKGDLLKLRLGHDLKAAVNKKDFIAPSEDGLYWLGATYDNKATEALPDEGAAKALLESAKSFYADKIVPLEHLAGIRPASYDRRPFVGSHHKYPKLSVLNGMGSKACLLAPHLSNLLLKSLQGEKEIPPEMALDRVERYLKKKAD